jgi:phage terminase large subunit-like protein
MYWDNKGRMPWQTRAYYQAQRQELRLIAYLRLHENRWVSSESGLFDMAKWDDATDPDHSPPLPSKAINLFVGCDASTKRDRSAIVSVYRDESGKIKLGPKRFWQPTKAQPMDLEETMESYLLELHKGFNLVSVTFDPYQFHRSAMTLQKQGLPMQELPQTTSNLTEMGQNLFDLVEYGNLITYACKDLRYEASVAIAKETPRGLRIAKEKTSQKIDQIVSLAMGCLAATKAKGSTFNYMFVDLNAPPKASGDDICPKTGLVDEHRRPMLRDTEPKQLEICRLNDCNESILMGCEYCTRHAAMRYR